MEQTSAHTVSLFSRSILDIITEVMIIEECKQQYAVYPYQDKLEHRCHEQLLAVYCYGLYYISQ